MEPPIKEDQPPETTAPLFPTMPCGAHNPMATRDRKAGGVSPLPGAAPASRRAPLGKPAKGKAADPSPRQATTSPMKRLEPTPDVDFLGMTFTARRLTSLQSLETNDEAAADITRALLEEKMEKNKSSSNGGMRRTGGSDSSLKDLGVKGMIRSVSTQSLQSQHSGGGEGGEPSINLSHRGWHTESLVGTPPVPPGWGQRTTMLTKLPFLWATLCVYLFGHVTMQTALQNEVQTAGVMGTVVYLVEGHTWIQHLFLNHVFVRHGLPLVSKAHNLALAPFLTVFWPLWWLAHAWGWFVSTDEVLEAEEVAQTVDAVRSGLNVILPVGSHQLGDKGETNASARRVLADLMRVQRQQSTPVYVVPVHVVWNRSPVHEEGGQKGWLTWMFGTRAEPGVCRTFFGILSDFRGYQQLSAGVPVSLAEFMQARGGGNGVASDRGAAAGVCELAHKSFETNWRIVTGPQHVPREEFLAKVLRSPKVREAIQATAQERGVGVGVIEKEAERIAYRMSAHYRIWAIRVMRYVMQYLLTTLFQAVYLDEPGLAAVRTMIREQQCPVVYMPTHKSHVDYLLLSFILFTRDMVVPNIAAGDNLNIPILGFIFRRCGAFFIRRSFKGDVLYKEIFKEYVTALLEEGHNVEFFIEGGRSRSGKVGQPRLGLLNVAVGAVLEKRVKNVIVAPISIQYDRVVEGSSYSRQLLGQPKQKESLRTLFASRKYLKFNFGNIVIKFGPPVNVNAFLAEQKDKVTSSDQVGVVAALAHNLVWRINCSTVVLPACLVSTILLTHSCRGISLLELVEHVQWLLEEIIARGGLVSPIDELGRTVASAIKRLGKMVKSPGPTKTLEPLLRPRDSHRLDLAYYRNHCLHIFVEEACVMCALVSMQSMEHQATGRHRVQRAALADAAQLISVVLKMEFSYRPASEGDNFSEALKRLANRGAIAMLPDDGEGERVQLLTTPQARRLTGLLRGILLPFLDAYWVAGLSLLPIQNEKGGGSVRMSAHLSRAQKIAETLYFENKVHSSEAASSEALRNAFSMFQFAGIIVLESANEVDDLLIRPASADERAAALERHAATRPNWKVGRPGEYVLFPSLLEAIRQIDQMRRLSVTCLAPLLGRVQQLPF